MDGEKITVTDEQIGKTTKRVWEIQRRLKEGTLPYTRVLNALQDIIEGKFVDDKRFEHVFTTEMITIPEFDMEMFVQDYEKDWLFHNQHRVRKEFTHEFLSEEYKPSTTLVAGMQKRIKVYRTTNEGVTMGNCINFINSQNGIFPNARGLLVATKLVCKQICNEDGSEHITILGIDTKNNLPAPKESNGRTRLFPQITIWNSPSFEVMESFVLESKERTVETDKLRRGFLIIFFCD